MSNDFYCDEVLSGKMPVQKVMETDNVLAFYHTRPSYPVHIVFIPKQHITSLLDVADDDTELMVEMLAVLRKVAQQVLETQPACRIATNLGAYQDSKHLHWHIISGALLEST